MQNTNFAGWPAMGVRAKWCRILTGSTHPPAAANGQSPRRNDRHCPSVRTPRSRRKEFVESALSTEVEENYTAAAVAGCPSEGIEPIQERRSQRSGEVLAAHAPVETAPAKRSAAPRKLAQRD